MQQEIISLRSDIERKRLAGLDALAKSGSGVESGIYGRDFSRRTYEHLSNLSEELLKCGWSVLVDATFIARWQRDIFRQLAERCGVDFRILDFNVPEDELRHRVHARSMEGRDASEADAGVLEHQLKTQEPLSQVEHLSCIPATSISVVLSHLNIDQ